MGVRRAVGSVGCSRCVSTDASKVSPPWLAAPGLALLALQREVVVGGASTSLLLCASLFCATEGSLRGCLEEIARGAFRLGLECASMQRLRSSSCDNLGCTSCFVAIASLEARGSAQKCQHPSHNRLDLGARGVPVRRLPFRRHHIHALSLARHRRLGRSRSSSRRMPAQAALCGSRVSPASVVTHPGKVQVGCARGDAAANGAMRSCSKSQMSPG